MKESLIPDTELLKASDVAPMLKTTPSKLIAAMLNGTCPIGAVSESDKAAHERTRAIIIKRRLDAWLAAKDLGM